ncbi:SDR family oxidoreductase [Cellulomonas timonensis]|uniref:SDR family oxidoreductase n=1 Tax=Cellulomonas timonensis TaxID=1689271 RepID=UPI00082B660E|nr:SDR family oxidoreductase [Cellulomonas timonensis]
MRRFEGDVAVVTGASRGIGLAIAERLVFEGARVVLTARDEDVLRQAAARIGPPERVLCVAGRADDPAHRASVLDLVDRELGQLDLLVNNAGVNPAYGPALEIEVSVVRKILDLNVVAALEWSRDAMAHGLGDGDGGAIVNIASIAGLTASPGIAFYGVSKAALISLTTQLAYELAPRVRVNAVAPAVIKTDFAKVLYAGREEQVAASYPLARLGVPADVSGPVAFLLSRDAGWITGQTLVIDGGGSIRPVS